MSDGEEKRNDRKGNGRELSLLRILLEPTSANKLARGEQLNYLNVTVSKQNSDFGFPCLCTASKPVETERKAYIRTQVRDAVKLGIRYLLRYLQSLLSTNFLI